PTNPAMDPSKEGLLRPENTRNSFDSTDAASPTDPLSSAPPATSKPRQSCCRKILYALAATFLVLGIASPVLYNAFHQAPRDGEAPPWYPRPRGGTAKTWAESYEKAAVTVGKMTLAEKVTVTTGTGWRMGLSVGNTGPAEHVGFPQLSLQDGPLGIRFA